MIKPETSRPETISVDAMGGDHGSCVTVPAALQSLADIPGLNIILVGDEPLLQAEIKKHKPAVDIKARVTIRHTTEVVAMDEKPSMAMRNKKDSSMRVAVNLVKEGSADACVSAGNTGALMAISRFVLKTYKNIDRPAIIFNLPTVSGHCHMLDLGANIDCTPEQLFQFGLMGSILSKAVDGNPNPSVALLNIGQEEMKGNEQIKRAAELLSAHPNINYIGYVEGNGIYQGAADVVVADGFIGNVALKTSEGLAKMIGSILKEELGRNWLTKIGAFITMPIWKAVANRMDPGEYNGGTLIGLQGTVIKSHGSADIAAFSTAIRLASIEVDKNVPALIEKWFDSGDSLSIVQNQ
ncbi:MAG TPA: phosphate acyltransferase PlsX [Pseudomonadales bacterium]